MTTPTEQFVATVRADFVERMRALPKRERTIWLSIFVEDLPPETLATLVGVSDEQLDAMMIEVERRLGLPDE